MFCFEISAPPGPLRSEATMSTFRTSWRSPLRTIWKGSNSFRAAKMWTEFSSLEGGGSSGRTFSTSAVTHQTKDGSAGITPHSTMGIKAGPIHLPRNLEHLFDFDRNVDFPLWFLTRERQESLNSKIKDFHSRDGRCEDDPC